VILHVPHSDPLTGLQWLCVIPFVSVLGVGIIAAWHKLTEKPAATVREGDCLPLESSETADQAARHRAA
jgi:hypothetical protein